MEERGNIQSLSWDLAVARVFQLSIFVAAAVLAPYFGNQLVTGSIINALLFISVSTMGIESAFLLCLVPSLISIYTGLLPLALAPMIPFIITGNALLVLVFSRLALAPVKSVPQSGTLSARSGQFNGVKFWLGAVPAALAKFVFIWITGTILANFVLHSIVKNVLLMISWPQLATAIAGAAIAFVFLKAIKKV